MSPGPSLTDTLCTRCGLCCDGSLFADVELSGPAEATRAEILGLRVDDDADGLMLLPCSALKERRCTVYAHRPACCRSFECGLLQNVRRGAVTVERAVEHVEDVQQRIGQVKAVLETLADDHPELPLKERCAEALSTEAGPEHLSARRRSELADAMADIEQRIRTTFLGGRRR